MIAALQDGWMLDWLKQALTPGVALAFVSVATLAWWAATAYRRFNDIEGTLLEMRGALITKGDLALTVQEMEIRLKAWADDRFPSRREFATCRESSERSQERTDSAIKDLFDLTRGADRR